MTDSLPNLRALALFLAVLDEGSLGAGARRLGMHQPNASRMLAQLESDAGAPLLERHPRGSRPTPAGLELAAHAEVLIGAARDFNAWMRQSDAADAVELRVAASMTIAEYLLPAWLAELRRRAPRVRVALEVLNSTQVLTEIRDGHLQLGFVETPHLPGWVNTRVVQEDELAVVIAPHHPWAERPAPVSLDELASTPLVVREGGSGTREAFEGLLGDRPLAEPAQVLSSNAAVRIAVAAGAGPAVLSKLTVAPQLDSGELLQVQIQGVRVRRPLTAVWTGPRRLGGAAAELLSVAGGTAG